MDRPHYTVRANEVIGADVRSPTNESLGEIVDIMLDKCTGSVRYAVLAFGGFLGVGHKLFAVPWRALHYNLNKDCFTLNTSKERLRTAPGFDKDSWPDTTQRAWQQSIENYYATGPVVDETEPVAEEEVTV